MLSPPAWPYSITQTSPWSISQYVRSSIRMPITEALSNLETSKSNFQCQENFGKGLNLENSAWFVFETISNHKTRILLCQISTHARASLYSAECSLLSIRCLVSSRNATIIFEFFMLSEEFLARKTKADGLLLCHHKLKIEQFSCRTIKPGKVKFNLSLFQQQLFFSYFSTVFLNFS